MSVSDLLDQIRDELRAEISAEQPSPSTPEAVTVPEAARLLGLSATAVYAGVKKGVIPRLPTELTGTTIVIPHAWIVETCQSAAASTTVSRPVLTVVDGASGGPDRISD